MFPLLVDYYTQIVQRLFPMFPQGGPGLALLLLRISVAAFFLMSIVSRYGVSPAPLIFAGALLICISLSVGFLTPVLSVIVLLAVTAILLVGRYPDNVIYLFSIVDAAVLALLGPGAYSIDAKLFGLRVTVVPPRKDPNRP